MSNYYDYLNSPEWERRRKRILLRDGFRCQMCGSGINLRVHHIRYPETLGQEPDTDLITLCDNCHQKVHTEDIQKKDRIQFEKNKWKRDELQWANENKFRDFIYGGSENMCSLKLLKESAREFGKAHGINPPAVSRLQFSLGWAHRKAIGMLYEHGISVYELTLSTPLNRNTIEKYTSGKRSEDFRHDLSAISAAELNAVVDKYVSKFLEGK